MDEIYKGILLSDHGDVLKRTLIEKCILPASETIEEENGKSLTCHGIFRIALETIGKSTCRYHQELSRTVYETWSQRHAKHLVGFLTAELLKEILTDPNYVNKHLIVELISFTVNLTDVGDVNYLRTVVMDEAVNLLDTDVDLNVASVLVSFVLKNGDGEDVGKGFDRVAFVRKLVRCMGRCRTIDMDQILSLIKNAKTVAGFMFDLLSRGDRNAIDQCFREMFVALSSSDSDRDPCCCLAAILSVFPTTFLENASKNAVLELRFNGSTLELILRRLLAWLMWPRAKNLDLIILHYMATLEYLNKHSLLIKATQQTACKLFLALRSVLWREFVLPVLLKMLLSYQHSPDVFHEILPCVPYVLECLQEEEDSSRCSEVSTQIVALVYTLMELFSGFPEIYDPILTELKKYSEPDQTKIAEMKDFLSRNKWTCETRSLVSASTLAIQTKSSTGKVGLCNLGNTCYANSVLQALYMNDEFRNKVLIGGMSSRFQDLFVDLQSVFTFLTHSQRAAYSPEAFLKVSRPPWFNEGHQQDCSEYLRYFLDKLHEQEVSKCIQTNEQLSSEQINGDVSTVCEIVGYDRNRIRSCLIHDLFGGELLVSYECFNCGHVSKQSETFIDLSLAVNQNYVSYVETDDTKHVQTLDTSSSSSASAATTTATTSSNGVSQSSLKLENLLNFYFSPEKLEGDNRYHCNSCNTLHNAQKTTKITRAPKYLILTLLRFSYDSKTHQRTKILENVDYPEVLHVPISHHPSDGGGNDLDVEMDDEMAIDSGSVVGTELYSLYAVVMHSGTSSDCGHYYTYACHSKTLPELFSHDKDVVKNVQDRSWYLFNDSRVSYSQYKSFCNVTQHFARDTAYLLFYRKITTVEVSGSSVSEDDPKALQLHTGLYEAVQKDNLCYLKELEDEALRQEQRKKTGQNNNFWRDFDDKNPPGSYRDGDGFGGFGPSARFVC